MSTLNSALPDWMAALLAQWLPQVPPFTPLVPEFETVELLSAHALPGSGQILNTSYYVTQATAVQLMDRFRAQRIIEIPAPGLSSDGGVVTIAGDVADVGKPAIERHLIFPVGSFLKDAYGNIAGATPQALDIEAGLLADYFRRMPEAQLPPQVLTIGWPPQSVTALSAAERDSWAMLRQRAGFAS